MGRVRDLHGKLKNVVANLSSKVTTVLHKQENEFLAAYRAHMYSVQKELQELRAKVDETELKLKKDVKISKLKEERDWYRKEALRLDSFATAMKKEMTYMKEKLGSIEDDRTWLEKQLKTCKKQNKLLQAELEMAITASAAAPASSTESETSNAAAKDRPTNNEPQTSSKRQVEQKSSNKFGRNNNNNKKTEQMEFNFSNGKKLALEDDDDASEAGSTTLSKQHSVDSMMQLPPSGAQMQEKRFRDMIKSLKHQLEESNHQLRCFRAHEVERSASKAEMEVFFNQSVEDVKREISRRRNKVLRAAHTRVLGKELTRAVSVGFDKFTATDRRRVLELLLSSDRVLSILHDKMFVSSSSSPQADSIVSVTQNDLESKRGGSENSPREVERPNSEMDMRSPTTARETTVEASSLVPSQHAILPDVSRTRPAR